MWVMMLCTSCFNGGPSLAAEQTSRIHLVLLVDDLLGWIVRVCHSLVGILGGTTVFAKVPNEVDAAQCV